MRSLLVLLATAACGGGTSMQTVDGPGSNMGSGSNHVDGLVNGHAFDAKDAISAQLTHTNGFSFTGGVSIVELADYAGACGLAAQKSAPTGSLILDLAVAIDDASGISKAPTGPGTFTVHSPANPLPASANVAQVYYGSGCGKDVSYEGTSGTITVTTVKPDGGLEGTFDVMVSCAGFSSCAGPDAHLTGTFSSAACTALDVNITPTCT